MGEQDDKPGAGEARAGDVRRPIELKVEYQRLNAFFADYTKNISRGGTFIQTETPLPIGTEFLFQLHVPQLDEPIRILGEVRWIQTMDDVLGAPGEKAGMGIRFIYAEGGQRQQIASVVEALMVESLGEDLSAQLLGAATRGKDDDRDA